MCPERGPPAKALLRMYAVRHPNLHFESAAGFDEPQEEEAEANMNKP